MEIEFITFDELMKIYNDQIGKTAEQERYMREVIAPSMDKLFSEYDESEKNGFFHT